MTTFLIKNIFILYILLVNGFYNTCFSQTIFQQDICNCGITGDGFSPGFGSTSGYFNINIDPTSTIKRAYLFMGVYLNNSINSYELLNKSIVFNGSQISLDTVTFLNTEFLSFQTASGTTTQKRLYLDVTNLVTTTTNIYPFSPPTNQISPNFSTIFTEFYLLVIYEKPTLNLSGYSIYINNQDVMPTMDYSLTTNPIESSNDVALIVNTSGICDTSILQDGSYVKINGNNIGLIGGQEPTSNYCSGPTGSFYYQDSILYGLGNDIANTTMSGVDLIANIQPYLTSTTNVDIEFEYQDIGSPDERTNAILELFLTYTTPCDTFSVSTPKDTIVCYGTQLQLNVTGGQKYEWLPSTGLSCDTCANPIFTADSTMHYTVRIWNNDSCSVVHPLQILVSQPKIENVVFTQPDCGAANGQLALETSSFSWLPIDYSINNGALQADSFFVNLGEGNYLLRAEDSLGCFADTLVFLQAVNNTVAQFNTTAGSTEVPVTVWGENQSQNADTYAWWVDGVFFSNSEDILPVFNTTGSHTIELIAWQYDPNCADTALVEFTIQHQIIVPTAFTPDGDGNNDFWEILYLDEVYPENQVFVYNRWGNLVYSSDKGDYNGRPWRGDFEGKNVAVGSYFYVIELSTAANFENEEKQLKGSVSVIR